VANTIEKVTLAFGGGTGEGTGWFMNFPGAMKQGKNILLGSRPREEN